MLAATKRAISFVVGEAAREENFGECGEIKSAGVLRLHLSRASHGTNSAQDDNSFECRVC